MRIYTIPQWEYYEPRLDAVWRRAKSAPRYAALPSFTPQDFQSLPLTQKSEVKKDPWAFATLKLGDAFRYYETTGTTGAVTPTPRTREDVEANVTSVAKAWGRLLSPGDRVLSLLPSDVVPVGDLIAGVSEKLGVVHTRAYPYSTGISDWARVFSLWKNLRPTAVFGAPGVVRELTKIALSRGEQEDLASSIQVLMLLGEVTADSLRTRFSNWWDCLVVNASYGSTETGTLAAGCQYGRLHLLPDANYFEVLTPDSRLVALSEAISGSGEIEIAGRLVVTPLNGYARPLLRFDTGDQVSIGEPCPCETEEPTIRIYGRSSDVLTIGERSIHVEELEEIVYEETSALGYVVQLDKLQSPSRARILLERHPSISRGTENTERDSLIARLQPVIPVAEFDAAWLNSLPASSRSGASQKSWKASNLRVGQW